MGLVVIAQPGRAEAMVSATTRQAVDASRLSLNLSRAITTRMVVDDDNGDRDR